MRGEFKQWLIEIQETALAHKREQARAAGKEASWKRFIWTSTNKNKAIKDRFRDEGAQRGYRSRPSHETKAGQWLYDFVWREFDENNNLLKVVLTMEIEVSESKISSLLYDFHKLLQADSEYKVFVFQTKTEADVQAAMIALKTAAQHYQSRSASKYLLCGWSTQLNQFSFDQFDQETTERTNHIHAEATAELT